MRSAKYITAKTKYWAEHIEKWKESGLLQKEYCAQNGLGLKSFGRWKRILKQSGRRPRATKPNTSAPATSPQLVPLTVLPDIGGNSGVGICLRVHSKYAIDISVGFHTETLQRLLAILD